MGFEGGEQVIPEDDWYEVAEEDSAIEPSMLTMPLYDEDGNEIPGYDSGRLFGNSIDRPVDFEKELSELNGKTVRMRIAMKDAEFYSFIFE